MLLLLLLLLYYYYYYYIIIIIYSNNYHKHSEGASRSSETERNVRIIYVRKKSKVGQMVPCDFESLPQIWTYQGSLKTFELNPWPWGQGWFWRGGTQVPPRSSWWPLCTILCWIAFESDDDDDDDGGGGGDDDDDDDGGGDDDDDDDDDDSDYDSDDRGDDHDSSETESSATDDL